MREDGTPRGRDPALRLCVTMTMLPRAPAKISARSLAARLAEAGWGVTVRTVERDLHRLRSVFPIGLDDEHKPFGWSWLQEPRLHAPAEGVEQSDG